MKKNNNKKTVNLALQGGGAHGAFAWGILDKFLEEDLFNIEGISATSAGSMNAIVLAQGMMEGGNEGARELLYEFWQAVGRYAQALQWLPGLPFFISSMTIPLQFYLFNNVIELFSPYQFNPFNIHPVRQILDELIDFKKIQTHSRIKLFICATHVKSGKIRIFNENELSMEVILASACLPHLFQAVEIQGEYYWDGGYLGNPAIFPLIYDTHARDILILHLVPMQRSTVPQHITEITTRLREISFNSSLRREMRAIAFVSRLIDEGWIKPEYSHELKKIRMHCLRADHALMDFPLESVYLPDWDFLIHLRDLGRESAADWLAQNADQIGKQSTVNFDDWL